MSDDDLRGSTPVYTAKDVLLGLDRKVGEMDLKLDGMNTAIQIIVSQNLNERLVRLESEGSRNSQRAIALAEDHEETLQRLAGAATLVKFLIGSNVGAIVVAAAALFKAFGITP